MGLLKVCFSILFLLIYESQGTDAGDRLKIEALTSSFYNKVVTGFDTPRISSNENGVVYLDLRSFVSFLEETRLFDDHFIENKIKEFQPCADAIHAMNYTGVTDTGWEPEPCFHFNYVYYYKNQESPDSFEVKDIEIEGNQATSKIFYYLVYEGKKHYWGLYLKLQYIKYENQWKIHQIDILDD